jgi:uroporphyrinogen-III synthase
MPPRVLVTRPEPAATRTAAVLARAGYEPLVASLMDHEALEWSRPALGAQAVMITSAAAARFAGPAAAALHALPTLCAGEATAAAARHAGFARAQSIGGDVAALLNRATDLGFFALLHLAGEDRTAVAVPAGLSITVSTVYRARLLSLADPGPLDAVLLYSQRSASHFAAEWARLGRVQDLLLAALSPAVLAAAGPGWQRTSVAATPDEPSLLAALADAGL